MPSQSIAYSSVIVNKTEKSTAYAASAVSKSSKSPAYRPYAPVMVWDWPQVVQTKSIAGTIYDASGNPVVGGTVDLVRQTDDVIVATSTTDGSGHYNFVRDADDLFTYYVLSWTSATTPQVHGMSDRGLVPS